MKFAINPATTMPYDFKADLDAYRKAGIDYMELWLDKVDAYLKEHSLTETRDLFAEHAIRPVNACCIGEVMLKDIQNNEPVLSDARRKLALCRDLGCPLMVVIPDFPAGVERGMYPAVEKNMRRAAEVAADYGIRLALEFLQGNKLVGTLATAKRLVRGAGHPNLGLMIDLSHFWMDRSHIEDIADIGAEELLLVHVDDMLEIEPEFITDYDRTFPGQGRGIEKELIPRIQATGYDGFWSLELFNKEIWNWPLDQILKKTAESFRYMEAAFGRPEA